MRKLLKITATLALALVFTAGTAFGQNSVDVEQSGGAKAEVKQTGSNGSTVEGLRGGSVSSGDALTQESEAYLRVEQVGGGGHLLQGEQEGTAGNGNQIQLRQGGSAAQWATIDQQDPGNNDFLLNQSGSGSGNIASVTQEGGDEVRGGNFAQVLNLSTGNNAAQYGSGNELDLHQATGDNDLFFEQTGDNNFIHLRQESGSVAEIDQGSDGNIVEGLSGSFTSENAELYVTQDGGDRVTGEQVGSGRDVAYINQGGGSNTVILEQK